MTLDSIDYWHWLIFGVVLLILEILLPVTFFLWTGVSALVVGVIRAVFPTIGWELQFILFGSLSVVGIVVWRAYHVNHPTTTDRPALNRRAEQYMGRTFTLAAPIENGVGVVIVDDTRWRVRGADMAEGKKVRVIAVDASHLIVEPVSEDSLAG